MVAPMTRYRIQTRTTTAGGNETHVSSVILSADEATADILTEATIHRAAGWHTVAHGHGVGVELVCSRAGRRGARLSGGATVRTLTIRESSPFDDTLPH